MSLHKNPEANPVTNADPNPTTRTEVTPSGAGQGELLADAWAREVAAELKRLCNPERESLGPALHAGLRVRIVTGWQEYAACAETDPEAWFPESMGAPVPSAVVRICAQCPVRRSCLASALLWSVQGIWAGTTAQDRQTTLRLLRAGAPIAEVLTAALDRAEAQTGRRVQPAGRRDWFHADAHTRRPTSTEGPVNAASDGDQEQPRHAPGAAA